MKTQVIAVLVGIFAVMSAQALEKRALVVFKSKDTVQAAQSIYQTQGAFTLEDFKKKRSAIPFFDKVQKLALKKVTVEASLANINTLVVRVNSEAELEALRNNPDVEMVEEEMIHPAPKLMNGFTLTAPESEMGVMARRSVLESSMGSFKPSQKTPWGILTVKAIDAWGQSNAGAGVRVLVLDTGIDRDHPSLKGNYEQGKDFVGDNNTPYPEADHVGHGTHCSGTIAGIADSSGFTGVAPSAKLLMGRVCSLNGCPNLAIAKGLSWAIEQHVDVVSMSLGGSMSTPAERAAILKAYNAGITIVAASGNDGTGVVSYPAALAQSIAVGAIDSTLTRASFSQYGPELAITAPGVGVVSSVPQGTGRASEVTVLMGGRSQQVPSSTFEGSKEFNGSIQGELVFAGLGKPEDFAAVNVQGKYAVVRRGEIKFMEKIENATKAGAVAILIVNNQPGLISGSLTQDGSQLPISIFMIEQTAGEQVIKSLSTGAVISAKLAVVATNYSSFDGTSMATPHVAGVVALVKAAKMTLTPAQVKQVLQSTAQAPIKDNSKNEYGAGIINAFAAVTAAAAF